MKKFACLVLVLVLFSMPIYAADLDLSSLSDEDLQTLQERILVEMDARSLSKAAILYAGHYTVGEDIKAGRYVFSFIPDGIASHIGLYDSKEAYQNEADSIDNIAVAATVPTATMAVEDGQYLVVGNEVLAMESQSPFAP